MYTCTWLSFFLFVSCRDDKAVVVPAVSNRRGVDFGPGIGRRSLYLYNLPEVASGRQVFKVPNISARFGTDPIFWNWAMVLTARLLPKSKFVLSVKRERMGCSPCVCFVSSINN